MFAVVFHFGISFGGFNYNNAGRKKKQLLSFNN